MNVFIDLGCNDGSTVEEFRNWSKVAFPDRNSWQIKAFDPNPHFKDRWKIIEDKDTVFEEKAAWVVEKELMLAIERSEESLGSTVMPGKKKVWDASPKIIVKAFDFSKWLEQYKDHFVVVKMDIEGAEFPLLDKMIKTGTITIPNKLLVEFHPNKVVEYTTQDKERLVQLIKDLGVDILEWH